MIRLLGLLLLSALAAGVARAQDTGIPRPEPAVPVPASYTIGASDWPPDALPTVPMPGDPTRQVRSPGARRQTDNQLGLEVTVSSPWPVWVEKGMLPVQIRVENTTQKRRALSLALAHDMGGGSRRVERVLTLGPKERAQLDVAIPGFGPGMPTYTLSVRDPAQTGTIELWNIGAPNWAGPVQHNVLLVGQTLPALGVLDDITAASPYALWSAATWDDLPRGPDALASWTSLDMVVLDMRAGPPPDEVLAPLLAWARLGGVLVLGPGEGALPWSVQPWVEERFAWPAAEAIPGLTRYAFGFGTLVLAERDDWASPEVAPLVWDALQRGVQRARIPDPVRSFDDPLLSARMPGVGNLPRGPLSALLLGLALLMGPVNLAGVALSRRPSLLLISTPLLALGSSLLLVTWGLLRDGLEVKVSSRTVTLLDQRSRTATTLEGRALYAGRAQAQGLRPAAGTVVLPRDHYAEGSWRYSGEEAREIAGSRFLPARQQVELVLLSERSTARALVVGAASSDGQTVTNQLGATIERLVLRDASGQWWLGEGVQDGAGANLRRADLTEASGWITSLGDLTLPMNAPGGELLTLDGLPPGAWLATLDGQPFRDDLGLSVIERPGYAAVLGVLEVP